MPEWLIQAVNTSALATGCLFTMYIILRVGKFLGPKLAKFFDDHSGLVDNLKTHNQTQSECLQRQTAMMHNLGQTLDDHGNILQRHGDKFEVLDDKIDRIHEHVVLGHREPHRTRPLSGESP